MATLRTETRESYETLKADLKSLRDEVKLQMHLANMELKDEWAKLEPRVDQVWSELSDTSVEAAKELKERLVQFRERLTKN